jgi:hypothetical protein
MHITALAGDKEQLRIFKAFLMYCHFSNRFNFPDRSDSIAPSQIRVGLPRGLGIESEAAGSDGPEPVTMNAGLPTWALSNLPIIRHEVHELHTPKKPDSHTYMTEILDSFLVVMNLSGLMMNLSLQLAAAKNFLLPRFEKLNEPGDSRGLHGLGPVAPADEEAVMSALLSVADSLETFKRFHGSSRIVTFIVCSHFSIWPLYVIDNIEPTSGGANQSPAHSPQGPHRPPPPP